MQGGVRTVQAGIERLEKDIYFMGKAKQQIEQESFALPLIKKKVRQEEKDKLLNESELQKNEQLSYIRCPLSKVNVQQLFHDILYETSRQPDLLMKLRQVMSQGYRELQEKKRYFQVKWVQLNNLNCSRQEYVRQEAELRQQQSKETNEVYQLLISILGEQSIPGFKTKETTLQEFRMSYMEQKLKTQDGPSLEEFKFYVDQAEEAQLKKDQITLLERLLSEHQLVEPVEEEGPGLFPKEPQVKQYVQRIPRVFKDHNNYNHQYQFRNHEQQQQVEDQSETFSLCDKLNVQKLITEKLRNVNSQKIEVLLDFLKLDKGEYQVIKKNTRVMLLDSKSDELYTDKEFQQVQTNKYIDMYWALKNDPPTDYRNLTDDQVDNLLELTTYLVNNAHYQQKYKQPFSQLQPKELLSLLDKIYKPH